MSARRSDGIAPLVLAAALVLPLAAGCQAVEPAAPAAPAEEPAVVEPAADDDGPARITLSAAAADRIGIATTPVAPAPTGSTVPYAALVYDAEGAPWAFVEVQPRTFERAALTVTGISGGVVSLSAGPPVGAEVVTTGAALLVGAEAGISGGE